MSFRPWLGGERGMLCSKLQEMKDEFIAFSVSLREPVWPLSHFVTLGKLLPWSVPPFSSINVRKLNLVSS